MYWGTEMKLLGIIAALALIAQPASAEIAWKVCGKYMEGTGQNALHVVAYRAPTPFPLSSTEQNWIKKIGSQCQTLWTYDFRCKKEEEVVGLITIQPILEGAAFHGDCDTGTMHYLAVTEVISSEPPH